MEINLNWLYGYAVTFGKIIGYVVILIGILMTFFLLETVFFGK